MRSPRIAIVGRDPELLDLAARAFDDAPTNWVVRIFDEVPDDADVTVGCPDVEGPNIRFDPARPAAVVDQVTEALEAGRRTNTVAVLGSGGGVGTTTVALHLALIRSRRRTTCVVEADPNRGCKDRLRLEGDVPTAASADPADPTSLMRAAIPVPAGFRVLLSGPDESCGPELLDACRRAFEAVVVDLGDGGACAVDPARFDPCVLVVARSIPAARRAAAVIERHPGTRWAIVTNKLGPGSECTRGELERALNRKIAVELPCSPALRDAEDDGKLVDRWWARWLYRLDRLAQALE